MGQIIRQIRRVYKMNIQVLLCLLVSVCAMSRLDLFKRYHEKARSIGTGKKNHLPQNPETIKSRNSDLAESRNHQLARLSALRRICTAQACQKCSKLVAVAPSSTSTKRRRRTCVHLLRHCCGEMRLI